MENICIMADIKCTSQAKFLSTVVHSLFISSDQCAKKAHEILMCIGEDWRPSISVIDTESQFAPE